MQQPSEKFFVMHILCKITHGVHTTADLNETCTMYAGGDITREQLIARGVQPLDACDPSTVAEGNLFEGWLDETLDDTHDHISCMEGAGWLTDEE